jgi:hypothetical protein
MIERVAPHGHQSGQHVLEDGLVQQAGHADQRLGIGDALTVDPAEGPIDQAPAHFPLALVEAPIVDVLEDQHPQNHGSRGVQAASALTQRMAPSQGLRRSIDEDFVVEKRIDLPKGGVPELGQEHFHQAALPVRSPHHGASGEADRVSRVARATNPRRSPTIANRGVDRQGNWLIRSSSDTSTPDKHRVKRRCSAPGSS